MAEYIENVTGQSSKLDWAFPFQRTGSFPIDRSSLFSSLEDAQKYASGEKDANGDATDSRKLGGSSYAGQIIAVYTAATTSTEGTEIPASVTAYIIQPDRSLKEVGAVYDDTEVQNLIAKVDTGDQTVTEYVATAIANAEVGKLTKIIVYSVDTENNKYVETEGGESKDAQEHVIYMVKGTNTVGDTYKEYMLINSKLEQIGDTSTDLSNFYTKSEVYSKSETDEAIADAVKDATGGESASAVLTELNSYKKAVNREVWGVEEVNDYTNTTSRIDNLETIVGAAATGDIPATGLHLAVANAQNTANTALQNASNNTTLIENLTKATTGGHEGDTSSLAYQIGQLNAYNTEHANDFAILKGRVDANEETLKDKANSSDVYTKTEIGTFDTANTTIVKMITDEATRADTAEKANANAIAAIYHKEGAADATGVLADEIIRATAAEQANADAIAALAGEGNTSTVKKNADDIASLANGAVKTNTEAITAINGADAGKSMREVAREEAMAIETAAMEFMGVTDKLPEHLTPNEKGHFYKVTKDINVSSSNEIINKNETISAVVSDGEGGYNKTPVTFSGSASISSGSSGRIVPIIQSAKPVKITLTGTYSGNQTDVITTENYFDYNTDSDSGCYITITIEALEDYTSDEVDAGLDRVTLVSIINATVVPVDSTVIKTGDSIIWSGYVWYVIPSGDDIEDTWRPITANGVLVDNTAALSLIKGENITITATTEGSITFDVPLATMERAGVIKGYTASTEDGSVTKTMIGITDGKITEVSTDLLSNGLKTLILDGGDAEIN